MTTSAWQLQTAVTTLVWIYSRLLPQVSWTSGVHAWVHVNAPLSLCIWFYHNDVVNQDDCPESRLTTQRPVPVELAISRLTHIGVCTVNGPYRTLLYYWMVTHGTPLHFNHSNFILFRNPLVHVWVQYCTIWSIVYNSYPTVCVAG